MEDWYTRRSSLHQTFWKTSKPEDRRFTYLVTAADQKLQAFWKRGKPGDLLSQSHLE